jgi:hypothetical protein
MTNVVRKQLSRIVVFILPLIAIICLIPLWISHYNVYLSLFAEDHFFENLQALFYLLSFLAALFIGIRFFSRKEQFLGFLYLLLAFALFVILMEEISWGQRIFGIANPAFFKEHNYQGELNIHNLDLGTVVYLHLAFTVVGFVGTFAWLIRLILPAKLQVNYDHMVNYLVPSWYLASYFLPVFLIYLYFDICAYLGGFFLPLEWREQEPAELLMSLGFLLFVIVNMHKQNLQR